MADPLDREFLLFVHRLDQLRAELKHAVRKLDADAACELFRDCLTARWERFEEQGVAGLMAQLAAIGLYELFRHDEAEADEPPPEGVPQGAACPKCGESDPDNLVWLEDETVRCAKCGNVYKPGGTP